MTKEPIPSDRVPVVIPQDNSSRYREMNLRNRRGDSSKNGVARTVGPVEVCVRSLNIKKVDECFLKTC